MSLECEFNSFNIHAILNELKCEEHNSTNEQTRHCSEVNTQKMKKKLLLDQVRADSEEKLVKFEFLKSGLKRPL